ncbi:hypothetical protein QN277_000614 [Acacia crassicarpa]|uniref:FAF domain-containing protein n=1 Tax=Acacia crassicarpa TaxID=499986 RepID=A0AAE1N5Q8_9FABA|nr:hypothetical protein QN277_000614 [Acacia crassicarpa]
MAAIVCHGLQSCLESQLVESRTLTLSFPFSPKLQQNPNDSPFKTSFLDSSKTISQERQSNKANTNTGWSFLQALSNVSHISKESTTDKESVYVHPEAKRSSSAMSQKSLELCTEKLGNETGSDIVDNNDYGDMDLLCPWPTGDQQQERPREGCLRKTRTTNFPPPLTTMRGSESLRVRRSYREDGSLVMEAIRVPPRASCFQAERSYGRLRLCFLKNNHDNFDPEDTEVSNDDDNEGIDEECESDNKDSEGRKQEEESESEEEEETEEEEEEEEEDEEMRRKEYERPRRCKEGRQHENNDLYNNWGEPISVS